VEAVQTKGRGAGTTAWLTSFRFERSLDCSCQEFTPVQVR